MDLVKAENSGEFALLGRADEVEGGPGAVQRALEKELDGTQGDGDGAGGDTFLGGEIEEIVTEFILGDEGRGFAVVLGELLDGEEIAGLGFGRETAQLHVFKHALTQRSHGDTSCRGNDPDSKDRHRMGRSERRATDRRMGLPA